MAELFRKVLCPVYFDETSPAALEYARHFARQSNGSVCLLHVVPTDELHLLRKVYRPDRGGGANAVWAEQVAYEQMQELADAHLRGVRYELMTRFHNDPAAGVLEAEDEIAPDVVVMGTHGRTGLAHLILGSVAEKVTRESRCPVFTTHRGDALGSMVPFQKILVPIDIAERSTEALLQARRIAEYSQGMVYPLHIVPSDETDLLLRDVYEAREGERANLVKAERVAKQKLDQLAQAHLRGVRYEPTLHVSGDPAKTIAEMERLVGADLLIMTTHGFHGLFRLLLGSLTEKMMRESSCPVLSLRQQPEAPQPPRGK